MSTVSVIIVSYKVRYYIEQCLDSVLRSLPQAQIIIVDNNSDDGSVEYLRERYPQVTVIANDHNVGFGKANNMALNIAIGEYVLFLNPDTVVAERTIPGCVEYMDTHPNTGAVGVRMQYGDGRFALESRRSLPTPIVSFHHMMGLGKLFPKSKLFARYHLTYNDPSHECGIDVVSGAYMFVRREALQRTGGFDEAFFMYGEDIDLSYRILQHGYKNIYLPFPIVHYKGESTNKTSYRYAKVFYDAMLIFFNKHFRRYSPLFTLMVRVVVSMRKIITYVGQNVLAHGRNLTDYSENSLYVGRKETFEQVARLLATSLILRNPQFVEGSGAITIKTEELDHIDAVLFDTQVFSYNDILDWSYKQALHGHRYTLGLYSEKADKLITPDEIL